MGYSKVLPFNAQALIDAAKPIIDKAQPYINAVWTHLEPHAATSRTHINTFFHGYEPWQILALASAATLVLMKVVSRLLT